MSFTHRDLFLQMADAPSPRLRLAKAVLRTDPIPRPVRAAIPFPLEPIDPALSAEQLLVIVRRLYRALPRVPSPSDFARVRQYAHRYLEVDAIV